MTTQEPKAEAAKLHWAAYDKFDVSRTMWQTGDQDGARRLVREARCEQMEARALLVEAQARMGETS